MRNKYCVSEFLSSLYALIITKIFYHRARLIRRPFYLRGKKSLSFGSGLTTGHFCRFDLDGRKKTLFIGKDCEFGDNTHIVALNNVRIGDNVLLASKVFISDTSHGCYKGNNQDSPSVPPNKRQLIVDSVTIGNNVWIGENVVVLPGANIGNGCVVGANSVVLAGAYPDGCCICGAPAKIVKKWNSDLKKWGK